MTTSRDHAHLTERMHRIITRDSILIVHGALVAVSLLDIFKESEESWPLEYKFFGLLALAAITVVGIFRLRRKSVLNSKPVLTIWAFTGINFLNLLFLANLASSYIYLMIVPIFLASVYYTERTVLWIYGILFTAIMVQPYLQGLSLIHI